MNIRLASQEDDIGITNILMTMISESESKEVAQRVVREILTLPKYISLVYVNKGIQGFGTLQFEPYEGANGVAEIVWLGVRWQERRQGIGASLVKEIEQLAINKGIRKVYIKTNSENITSNCFWITQRYKFEARMLDFGSAGVDYYMLGKEIV
ncbi:GNAT family N-acetyltransferase [Desulfosporosinus sp. FKA]|uniref:GNAT family N-acetyltransferase n=1 Tax=Desulfosporosinus sp. FKA TaxID=1969834 RepID=UPI000B49DED5|nr:GNAT family N-acetyltransferase [Desulfosporosinus sp. FKA]